MPHVTVWEEGGIYWKFHGRLDAEELHEANGEMLGDARFDLMDYYIWDALDVTELGANEEDANETAFFDVSASTHNQNIKGALLATDSTLRMLLEVYITTSAERGSPWKLQLFDNLEDARAWLAS